MRFTVFKYNDDPYRICWLTKEEWDYRWYFKPKYGSPFWFLTCFWNKGHYPRWFLKSVTRGYTSAGIIYIKEGTKIGLEKLILHEIGHILGLNHTGLPTIMNPTWLFRWFKTL